MRTCRIPGIAVLLVGLVAGSSAWTGDGMGAPKGKGLAVCVGVNSYYSLGELKYSVNDAVAIKNSLETSGDFTKLYLLTEKDENSNAQPFQFLPMQNNIIRVLKQASGAAGKDDQLLFFFSGHGVERDGKHFIVPLDGDENTGISIDEIKAIMAESPAESKLLLIDACRSGSGMKGIPGIRGSVDNVEIGMIVSCGKDQFSFEDEVAQRSVFSLALEEGLLGSADLNEDKVITGEEVFEFLTRRIQEFCVENDRFTVQTPQINDSARKARVLTVPEALMGLAMSPGRMLAKGKTLLSSGDDDGQGTEALALFGQVAAHDKAGASEKAEAYYLLGKCSHDGLGGERDLMAALDYWEKAADAGNPDAQYELGRIYLEGKEVNRDFSEAAKWIRMAAEQDKLDALVILGEMLYTGKGMKRNYTEAAKYFRRAANQNNGVALRFLGLGYYEGNGFKQNNAEAIRWFARATENGDDNARYWQGVMLLNGHGIEKDMAKAVGYFTEAGGNGDVMAQNMLGELYATGRCVPADAATAAKWYGRAADQGDGEGQLMLARLYESGQGIEKNTAKALQLRDSAVGYLREHAEQGDVRAQALLGVAYSEGEGVARDFKEAEKWLTSAAEQNNSLAQFSLGNLYFGGKGVEQSYDTAANWYRKAAVNGSSDAQTLLGSMYYMGKGFDKDPEESANWYRMAAENGSVAARRILSAMYYVGDGVKKNTKEALLLLETSEE